MIRESSERLDSRVVAVGYIGECLTCKDDLELQVLRKAGVEVEECPRCEGAGRVEERFFDWTSA